MSLDGVCAAVPADEFESVMWGVKNQRACARMCALFGADEQKQCAHARMCASFRSSYTMHVNAMWEHWRPRRCKWHATNRSRSRCCDPRDYRGVTSPGGRLLARGRVEVWRRGGVGFKTCNKAADAVGGTVKGRHAGYPSRCWRMYPGPRILRG